MCTSATGAESLLQNMARAKATSKVFQHEWTDDLDMLVTRGRMKRQ
jgi:hypothetical protein